MKEKIRALLIDDDQGDFVFTKGLLSQIRCPTIELDWVPTFEEGHDAMARGEYDIYLVDYFLEDRTGLDLLREAARHQLQAPVIMLTGRGSHDIDIEAMQAGAADYLVKGQIEAEDLERSIRYALDRMEAQRALRLSEERHRGMFDHLPMGVYRCTPEGEFLDANPALVRILGYPDPASLASLYAYTFYVNAEDEETFKARLREFGIVRGFETQLRGVDGRNIRLRNTARIHRDADGEVGYVEGVIEDVSRTWRSLGMYQEAARYKALYECGHIGILTLEPLGRNSGWQPCLPCAVGLRGGGGSFLGGICPTLREGGSSRGVGENPPTFGRRLRHSGGTPYASYEGWIDPYREYPGYSHQRLGRRTGPHPYDVRGNADGLEAWRDSA